jgi:hypothetical protein
LSERQLSGRLLLRAGWLLPPGVGHVDGHLLGRQLQQWQRVDHDFVERVERGYRHDGHEHCRGQQLERQRFQREQLEWQLQLER